MLLSALTWLSAGAQTNKPTVVPENPQAQAPTTPRPASYKVPLLAQGLRLSDFAGMSPRAGLREQLTEITGFTQNSPADGQPATQKTEVWLGRTAAALYVVFVCHDSRPGAIRGHLARRENVLKDDRVSVLLDPLQDRRKGVMFSVNPAGVQADAEFTENNGADYSYDVVWDSDGKVTSDGWMALFAIPFRSLRFRPTAQGWGVVLRRDLPRNSETDFWPRVSANVSGILTQEGTLLGIEGVTGSRNIQINPYVLAQNEHTLLNLDPANPYFSTRKLEGTAGGEAKAIIKDTVVLDATVNPDFSQVESDQPQFTVNQRYPVYFPELRPFFLENASYFATPIGLLYTRNIVRPEFGGRVTGKAAGLNIGFLGIDDREPGEAVPQGDPAFGKHAPFAVGRVSKDIGVGSSVGAIYTDEEFNGSWNRIGGLDFTVRFNDKWTSQGQWVESSTKGADGSYAAGPASYLEFTRNGHGFNFDDNYKDYSAGFQSEVGFVETTNLHNNNHHATYEWYPKHGALQGIGLETNSNLAWDHQGNRVYRYLQVDPFFQFTRNTTIAPIGVFNSDTLTPAEYPVLPQDRNFAENQIGVVFRSAPVPQLNFNLVGFYGGNVNYNPLPGAPPSLMHQNNLQALITLQPIHQLTLDNTYLLDRNHSAVDGRTVFENQTLRTKINYQFTRAFSARVIVEYDSLLVNPAETSLVRTKQVSTSALLTWLPHPGTAIYLGYNNDLQNLNHQVCTRVAGNMCDPTQPVEARANTYLNDGRQLFLKVSYLLRF